MILNYISDFLWGSATSDPFLLLLGILAMLCGAVGYFPVLSSLSIFASYVTAARFLSLFFLAALCFLIGFRVADNRAELRTLQGVVEIKDRIIGGQKLDLSLAKIMAEQADEERKNAADRAKEATYRINEYAIELKKRPNPACLLTLDDFPDRLRNDAKRK